MSDPTDILSETTPAQEVAGAKLGDKRRTDRLVRILDALARRPDRSIPEALEDEADQEGYYRFIRNPNVQPEDVVEPHFDATAGRAEMLPHVLCIHDTTEFAWNLRDGHMREHLAELSARRQGFKWHSSIVTSADGTRAPLGTVAAQPFVHQGDCPDEETVESWDERGGIFDNEKWRWFLGVERAEARLEDVDRVTHVMDREGDDFEMLFCMVAEGYDFLVRMCIERNVCTGERRSDYESIREALADRPWRGHREVELSARPASKASSSHPVRRARSAKLRARAATVEIRRPDNVKVASTPDRLELNVVQVREVNAPAGEEPVEWLLITTHEVETAEQIWQVVDWYRGRWVTEEFYKAIKTGCGYTDLQHRSAKTLLCALAACTVVAHHLLALRYLGRNAQDLPAEAVVTDVQLQVVKAISAKSRPQARQ